MSRLEATLEIRKGLHELSHIFARCGIDHRSVGTQVHHETSEEPLGSAYRLEREVGNVVAHPCSETAHLVAQEYAEIYVFEDELDMLNAFIEMCAFTREETRPAPCLSLCEYEEPYEESERYEDEDERCHDS